MFNVLCCLEMHRPMSVAGSVSISGLATGNLTVSRGRLILIGLFLFIFSAS